MKRLRNWLVPDWYQTILFITGLFFVGLLLWFQLGSLVPGLSEGELAQTRAVTSFHDIRANPLNFPYKVLQYGLERLDLALPAVRLVSTVFGLGVLVSLFYILKNWYSRRVAILGSLLFVGSAWFLHTARLGTDSIVYALPIALIAVTIWLQKTRGSTLAIMAGVLLTITLLYTPGIIWLVVPLVFWQMGNISRFMHGQNPVLLALLGLAGLAVLAPLGLAFYEQPALLKTYFGLAQTLPAPLDILKNLARVPVQIFFRSPDDPAMWLGHLSLLSWFSSVMFVIGTYGYWLKRSLDRTKFMAYIFGLGIILIALGGPVSVALLLPFTYIIVAGGIALMLQQWFTVFPRNPVARTFGPTLLTVAVLMAAYYNINYYFIAWPNAPETKAAFSQSADQQ